jgi:hypothetical protein
VRFAVEVYATPDFEGDQGKDVIGVITSLFFMSFEQLLDRGPSE